VARGERESDAVKAVLSTEMRKIFERAGNHNGNHFRLTSNHDGNHSSGTSRVAAKKKKVQKKEANLLVATIRKETAQPRVAKSARIKE
jgi:CMP-2-keto-3-deoxyoctulosonic acid synthetase